MTDLDPYLLRAFVTVAEVGTVNGAAATMNRTQAAVSMQIRKLEGLLGVRLFQRSTKGVELTADGQILMPFAREIITLNQEVGQRLKSQAIEGRIRFGVVEDFAATRLIDILRAFHDQNPRVEMDILVEPNRRLAAKFADHELDILVCDTSCLDRKPLLVWTEYLLWAVRADMVINSADILPVVMFDETCPWHVPAVASLSQGGGRWQTVCVAPTLVAMATAVRVGIGVAPMIAATVPADCRSLDQSPEMPSPIRIDIGLYARPDLPPGMRPIVDFIARQSFLGRS